MEEVKQPPINETILSDSLQKMLEQIDETQEMIDIDKIQEHLVKEL